ncbi:hypothetical protein AMECASPLE_035335 [Ameca splendens]|uniref:Uncharacterized protein n=1 Tax=Ameca splendens TaxID=208324 RepID=A0ABV0ZS97_9TELE
MQQMSGIKPRTATSRTIASAYGVPALALHHARPQLRTIFRVTCKPDMHCGRPEYLEKIHTCTGIICKLHAKRHCQVFKPRIFLQGSIANNCSTMHSASPPE